MTSCHKTKTAAGKQGARWGFTGTFAMCASIGLYYNREVLSGCPDGSTGGDDVRKGGGRDWRMTEGDEEEEEETEDGPAAEGCHQQQQAAEWWNGKAGRCFGESLPVGLVRMDCICILTTKVRQKETQVRVELRRMASKRKQDICLGFNFLMINLSRFCDQCPS